MTPHLAPELQAHDEHRAALEEKLGWEIKPEAAATDLAAQSSSRPQRIVARVGERLLDRVTPDELEDGPSPGEWRREHSAARQRGRQQQGRHQRL